VLVLVDLFLLVAVALLAGFASGFFGIGGGIVLVPCFLFILPKLGASTALMHGAVATSLALLIPTAFTATRAQKKHGHFDLAMFRLWGVFVAIGAIAGAVIADFISSRAIMVCFASFLCLALCMQLAKKFFSSVETENPNKKLMIVFACFIGAVSTILGIGGGLFSSSALRIVRYPLRKSIAIATASALIIGVVGAAANIYTGLGESGRAIYSMGYISLPAFFITAPFMTIMAPVGVRAANLINNKILKVLYMIFFFTMTLIIVLKTIAQF
jgi:uncharacterized protein